MRGKIRDKGRHEHKENRRPKDKGMNMKRDRQSWKQEARAFIGRA